MDLKIKPKTKMTIINRSQEDGPRVIEKIEVVKDFIYPGIKYEQLWGRDKTNNSNGPKYY